jgi:glutamate racemase
LKEQEVDTLILGCTHYPVLKPVIARFMGPEVTLVDSADALAEAAATLLAVNGQLTRLSPSEGASVAAEPAEMENVASTSTRQGKLVFYLSDIPWKFTEVGARFLGQPIADVTTVNLNEAERDGCLAADRKERA